MKVVQLIEYYLIRICAALIQRVPLATAQRIAAAAARWVFDRGGRRARYARINLRLCFPELPEAERERIGRESFVHMAWNVIDFVRSARLTDEELRQRVEIKGMEHYEAALRRGHGALLLTLHLGNFELGAVAAPLRGLRATWMGRPMRNPYLYAYLARQRIRTGGGLIGRRNVVPTILRELRAGKAVGILNDQYARRSRSVFVPFFGLSTSTSAGIATIALRSRTPVLPMYISRDGPDHHTVTLLSPIEPEYSGDLKSDVVNATTSYNRVYEQIIREHPEQNWWITRRFRNSPDLQGNPYV